MYMFLTYCNNIIQFIILPFHTFFLAYTLIIILFYTLNFDAGRGMKEPLKRSATAA